MKNTIFLCFFLRLYTTYILIRWTDNTLFNVIIRVHSCTYLTFVRITDVIIIYDEGTYVENEFERVRLIVTYAVLGKSVGYKCKKRSSSPCPREVR